MNGLLDGRRALVAGSDAIGTGIAARLAAAGAAITSMERGDPLPSEPLDILVVNLLGAPATGRFEDQPASAFAAALGRVSDTAALMAGMFPMLNRMGAGRVILVGHRYGTAISDGIAPYNTAAWALHGLVRSAAVEWGRYGITANLVLPLAVTPELAAAQERRPAIIERMVSQLPLGRAGDPVNDVGGAVLFLASDDARFVNGQTLHADGGQHVAGAVLSPARFA